MQKSSTYSFPDAKDATNYLKVVSDYISTLRNGFELNDKMSVILRQVNTKQGVKSCVRVVGIPERFHANVHSELERLANNLNTGNQHLIDLQRVLDEMGSQLTPLPSESQQKSYK